MILDARKLTPHDQVAADVCIVGGGAAGISLALELARMSSLRICMLEAGGPQHERETQALLDGEVVGASYPDLRETRLAALGGSTALWAGWCRPLDAFDFETREWIPNSGWPFGFDELTRYYRRAHELCRLGPFDYDADALAALSGRERLPLAEPFRHGIVHMSSARFGTLYGPDLGRSKTIRLLMHAPAVRLDPAAHGGAIESVRIRTVAGNAFDVTARVFVLAAGGIENARLLLLSGDSSGRGIGNTHGQVGRFFMEHGFVNSGSLVVADPVALGFHFPHVVNAPGGAARVRGVFTIDRETMRRERLLNCAMFLHPPYESHPVFDSGEVRAMLELWDMLRGRAVPSAPGKRAAIALRSPRKLALAVFRKLVFRRKAVTRWRMRALFECRPERDNRVRLADDVDALGRRRARVEWQVGDADLQSVMRAHELLDESLRRSGVGYVDSRFPRDAASWAKAIEGGKHHMGATRMHDNPACGVVDANCLVHGTANLYVAGSSVFPTGGFANPTLTIVALAARLAEHLAKHFGPRQQL